MAMRIETPAEACAALAAIIVAADELGTTEERTFLFETIGALPIFEGLDRTQFTELMAATTAGLYDSVPTDGGRMSSEGVGPVATTVHRRPPGAGCPSEVRAALMASDRAGAVLGWGTSPQPRATARVGNTSRSVWHATCFMPPRGRMTATKRR
jgi:hypothetical protein